MFNFFLWTVCLYKSWNCRCIIQAGDQACSPLSKKKKKEREIKGMLESCHESSAITNTGSVV